MKRGGAHNRYDLTHWGVSSYLSGPSAGVEHANTTCGSGDDRSGLQRLRSLPGHVSSGTTGTQLASCSGKGREFPAGVKLALLLEVLQQHSSERQVRIEFVFVVLTVLLAGNFEQVTRDTDPGEKVKH